MAEGDQAHPMEMFSSEAGEAHEVLILAIHQLEVALLAATRGSDPNHWRAQAAQETSHLIECLAAHCHASGEYGGLIAEMEYRQGKSEYLTRLQESHDLVLERAQALLNQLRANDAPRTPSYWLRRMNELSSAVHEHEAREIDVIYETFWRDPVGGD